MPIYLVKEKSLIGNRIYEEGEHAEYDGLPAENLEPTCDEGRAKQAEYFESNRSRIARMIENGTEDAGTSALVVAFAKAQESQTAALVEAFKAAMAPAPVVAEAPAKAAKNAKSEAQTDTLV